MSLVPEGDTFFVVSCSGGVLTLRWFPLSSAMEMAAQHGSGWVSVKNTNHYGIAGFYSLQAAQRDMIGFSMTNSSAVVAPLWGRKRMLGTNPIAVA